jgi:hypothetical protein
VRRPDGSLFLRGETGADGTLTIEPDGHAGPWSAVFLGSMGHRAETQFELKAGAPGRKEEGSSTPQPVAVAPSEPARPLAERGPVPWTEVLAGLAFIFGLSALLMCLKLRAQVRGLAARRSADAAGPQRQTDGEDGGCTCRR